MRSKQKLPQPLLRKASVIGYSDLEANNFDYAAVKAKGLQRTEGKEYVVNDGDVIEFLFNV